MTSQMSLTIKGLLVLCLSLLFQWSGVEIANGEIEKFIAEAVELIGIMMAWYGRVRLGDISLGGFRKNETK